MLNKLCRWLESNKLVRLLIPFSGSSLDEISPEQAHQPDLHDDNTRTYPCQFCHQSGKDRFKAGPCRVCNGHGTVQRSLKNPTDCKHCQGKGVEPYRSQQCSVCSGGGVIEKKESPPTSKIPITYSRPEKSKEQQEIKLSNKIPQSTKGEPL